MNSKWNEGIEVNSDGMVCPSCGESYLHHEEVEVFEREEGRKNVLHVSVKDGGIEVDDDMEGNPSSARGGVLIHFWCEICHAKTVLSFSQHKGATHVGLGYTSEEEDEYGVLHDED